MQPCSKHANTLNLNEEAARTEQEASPARADTTQQHMEDASQTQRRRKKKRRKPKRKKAQGLYGAATTPYGLLHDEDADERRAAVKWEEAPLGRVSKDDTQVWSPGVTTEAPGWRAHAYTGVNGRWGGRGQSSATVLLPTQRENGNNNNNSGATVAAAP